MGGREGDGGGSDTIIYLFSSFLCLFLFLICLPYFAVWDLPGVRSTGMAMGCGRSNGMAFAFLLGTGLGLAMLCFAEVDSIVGLD